MLFTFTICIDFQGLTYFSDDVIANQVVMKLFRSFRIQTMTLDFQLGLPMGSTVPVILRSGRNKFRDIIPGLELAFWFVDRLRESYSRPTTFVARKDEFGWSRSSKQCIEIKYHKRTTFHLVSTRFESWLGHFLFNKNVKSGIRTHADLKIHWILSPTPLPLGHPDLSALKVKKKSS